jgi:hypothetical protein
MIACAPALEHADWCKSWPKEELEIGKPLKMQGNLELRCIGNNVI